MTRLLQSNTCDETSGEPQIALAIVLETFSYGFCHGILQVEFSLSMDAGHAARRNADSTTAAGALSRMYRCHALCSL
jgi:hypothetical protein